MGWRSLRSPKLTETAFSSRANLRGPHAHVLGHRWSWWVAGSNGSRRSCLCCGPIRTRRPIKMRLSTSRAIRVQVSRPPLVRVVQIRTPQPISRTRPPRNNRLPIKVPDKPTRPVSRVTRRRKTPIRMPAHRSQAGNQDSSRSVGIELSPASAGLFRLCAVHHAANGAVSLGLRLAARAGRPCAASDFRHRNQRLGSAFHRWLAVPSFLEGKPS
jgi:hypothetical protein